MKLNKYFLIGAMGLGLFACSDDLDGNAGQDNGNKVQEGTTYAAFTIKVGGGTNSRAIQPGNGVLTEAEGNEEYVKSATIIITKENDVIEHVLTEQDQDATTKKYVVQTTTGEKKVYAYLNQQDMNLPTVGDIDGTKTWIGDDILIKKASDLGVYNDTEAAGTPFAMSSVEVAPLSVKAEVTRNEALTTSANNVIVTVERVVAKVTVELDENFETANENKFNLITLKAQIGNPDNLEYKDGALATSTTGSYRMAYNDDNNDRQTPYFSYPNPVIDWDKETANFETEVYPSLLSGDEVEVTNGGFARFYCLENTHAVSSYMNYNTTFVRLYAEMTPKNAESLAPAYTDGTLTFAAVSETTESNTPETFYEIVSAPEAYKSNVGKYITASKMAAIYDELVENGTAGENEKADAVVAELNKMNISFVKYTDGKGYYHIWVNDQSETSANTAPVFRNDWYALNITKITLPGDPKDGFEPGPIHPDTHLAVMLTIKQWNKVSHDITLQ